MVLKMKSNQNYFSLKPLIIYIVFLYVCTQCPYVLSNYESLEEPSGVNLTDDNLLIDNLLINENDKSQQKQLDGDIEQIMTESDRSLASIIEEVALKQSAETHAMKDEIAKIFSAVSTTSSEATAETEQIKTQLGLIDSRLESLKNEIQSFKCNLCTNSSQNQSSVLEKNDKVTTHLKTPGNKYSRFILDQAKADASRSISERNITKLAEKTKVKSCAELRIQGFNISDVYKIFPFDDHRDLFVYCDMQSDKGGWTVFQKRGEELPQYEIREQFFRNWSAYEKGFGSPYKDYWLGLENLFQLTQHGPQEIIIELTKWNGEIRFAKYAEFSISDATDKYRLSIGSYSGTAADSLTYHTSQKFSTFDSDNDQDGGSCASKYGGAWWYKACYQSNLNGPYWEVSSSGKKHDVMAWNGWTGDQYGMKTTRMKIRPRYF